MTLETATILQKTLRIIQVDITVSNVHEMNSLENKIRKYALIKQRNYVDDVDEWNRPTTIKSTYLLFVKPNNQQPLKAMITQRNKTMKSEITLKDITSVF